MNAITGNLKETGWETLKARWFRPDEAPAVIPAFVALDPRVKPAPAIQYLFSVGFGDRTPVARDQGKAAERRTERRWRLRDELWIAPLAALAVLIWLRVLLALLGIFPLN